jgi:hypothetical protein
VGPGLLNACCLAMALQLLALLLTLLLLLLLLQSVPLAMPARARTASAKSALLAPTLQREVLSQSQSAQSAQRVAMLMKLAQTACALLGTTGPQQQTRSPCT